MSPLVLAIAFACTPDRPAPFTQRCQKHELGAVCEDFFQANLDQDRPQEKYDCDAGCDRVWACWKAYDDEPATWGLVDMPCSCVDDTGCGGEL